MQHKKVNKRSPLNQMLSVGILLSFLMISSIDVTTDTLSLSVTDRAGWICSLNHGVLPKTPEVNVRYFIEAIREQFSNGS